jgi:hypothetical protein
METFVMTNDTLLSMTLLALFLLLSFELLEYFGSKLSLAAAPPPKLVHTKITSSLPSLDTNDSTRAHNDQVSLDNDPMVSEMNSDGFVTPFLLSEMAKAFPNESHRTLTRFLIARKGSLEAATEMLRASLDWKSKNLNSIEEVRNALNAKALFSHSKSKSGTSVIYFRGALYDRSIASTTDYVKAAAHLIEQQFHNEVSENKPSKVSVLIHTAYVEGGINAPADLAFIKEFVKVLSDNFPERLERLIIYPFPWFGRAIWSVAKTFIDQRTVDKVLLLAQGPDGEYACPPRIAEFIDFTDVPIVCGGKCSTAVSYP